MRFPSALFYAILFELLIKRRDKFVKNIDFAKQHTIPKVKRLETLSCGIEKLHAMYNLEILLTSRICKEKSMHKLRKTIKNSLQRHLIQIVT